MCSLLLCYKRQHCCYYFSVSVSDSDALAATGSSMFSHHGNVQIVAWVDKLAFKPKGKEPDLKETKWRQRAADAIVLHCMHDLLVSLECTNSVLCLFAMPPCADDSQDL
jgi:hypothetical protein